MKELRHIFCVDDEEDILEVVKLCLEVDDFEITTCSSGEEVVRQLPDAHADLVLLDVMMPRMGGPATLAALKAKEETRHVPVIFMTARVRGSEIDQYMHMGAIGVIPKPFDPSSLTSDILRIWKKYEEGHFNSDSDIRPEAPTPAE